MPNEDDDALAARLATEAGQLLLRLRADRGFADPTALRDAGDATSHRWLADALQAARPGDALLSEEGVDDKARLTADRVWIVDPLDGTREYGEAGRVDWAVHVALWRADQSGAARPGARGGGGAGNARGGGAGELVAGAVALPGEDRTFATGGSLPALPAAPERLRVVVSRTRAPAFVTAVAAELDAELVPMGSAGAKVMAILLGRADVYVHDGGMYEWDSAAPVAVARAAGLHASRADGTPLRYNNDDPTLPDLVICRPELAERVLDVVGAARNAAR